MSDSLKKIVAGLLVVVLLICSGPVAESRAADGGDYLKYGVIGAGALVVGVAAFVFAAPIAATVGATGLLGTASTGTAISTLSGAAAANASLAALGGGALSTGGMGMAGGTALIAADGAFSGGVVSAAASKFISDDEGGEADSER